MNRLAHLLPHLSQPPVLAPVRPRYFRIEGEKPLARAPIVKWAGGKSQLLQVFDSYYPRALRDGKIQTYVEPFVGGAAVFFDVRRRFAIRHAHLIDANPEIRVLYTSIRDDIEGVVGELKVMEQSYLCREEEGRKAYYYAVRDRYNDEVESVKGNPLNIIRAAQTLFLNRTCFNGLYRVNSKGRFNVPMGRYLKPRILHEERLRRASAALQIAEIHLGDFTIAESLAGGTETFVYYDPPYRPINTTSYFTSYSTEVFSDDEQRRVEALYRRLHARGVSQMLSNSDPTNHGDDRFFDNLYSGFNIHRVEASRRINATPGKRGAVRELLITNY
jgi:DNA adenine methylase